MVNIGSTLGQHWSHTLICDYCTNQGVTPRPPLEEYTKEHDNFFDYKNVFKNNNFVQTMTGKIKSDYIRLTRRNTADSFSSIYNHFIEIEKIVNKPSA